MRVTQKPLGSVAGPGEVGEDVAATPLLGAQGQIGDSRKLTAGELAPVPRAKAGGGRSLLDAALLRDRARALPEVEAVLATTLKPGVFASTVPETDSVIARRVDLVGRFDFADISVENGGRRVRVAASEDAAIEYGGVRYLEFPNSTALSTVDPRSGALRELVLTRGVRPYENVIEPGAGTFNAPRGYVSDVLLFERTAGGLEYRHTLLASDPESKFLFEDPRISVLHGDDGTPVILLSGTDYSPHVAGSNDPDVMNRGVVLELDATGLPKPVELDAKTKRPAFFDLSPPPAIRDDGGAAFVDAKNGTVAMNERGEVVVRSRMRPSFDQLPEYAAFAKEIPTWKYGEQVFVFASFDEMLRYDWRSAMRDLFHLHTGREDRDSGDRVRPLRAKVVATEASFPDLYPPEQLAAVKSRGFGPGTIPVRVAREGDRITISDGKNAPQLAGGKIPAALLDSFPIADGSAGYVSFDHELRAAGDPPKRVYSWTIKLWNDALDTIDLVYADAVQPLREHQRGGSGILDLHHTYPMGRVLLPHGEDEERAMVRVYAGAADAHTESLDFDLVRLLSEMAAGSERKQSGQVYRPAPVQ